MNSCTGIQEGFMMRMTLWAALVLIGMELSAVAAQPPSQPQSPGQDMKMEMGKPAPPAGPLKIAFGDKSAEWTAATLAALPHKTITLYNEHAKANQT